MANEPREQKKRETERGHEGEPNPRREGDQSGGQRREEPMPERGGGHPGGRSE